MCFWPSTSHQSSMQVGGEILAFHLRDNTIPANMNVVRATSASKISFRTIRTFANRSTFNPQQLLELRQEKGFRLLFRTANATCNQTTCIKTD